MKSIKKYYLLLLLIITLACVSIYGTYAMFTSEIGIDAFKLEASTIPVDQEIMEYEKITINANDSKTISLNVSNSTSQVLHYGAWYQMISPDTINDNITIAKLTDSPDETSGTIDGNSNKIVYIYIGNNSSSEITLYVGIKYSETSSLGLPDNRVLITGTRDGKYVVGVTVTNGTVENGATLTNLITNGSFEDGSMGWSTSRLTTPNNRVAGTISSSKHATGNNSLYINDTSDTTGYWNYQYFTASIGDLLYIQSKAYVISRAFRMYVTTDINGQNSEFNAFTFENNNKFMLYSIEYKATSTTQFFQIGSSIALNSSEGYLDDIMILNLNENSGSNYPSKEILDRSISYFDGSVSYNYKKLNKGNGISFKVTPTDNAGIESVSCTNSNASYNENNDELTISNITGDVNCNVKFKEPITVAELVEQMKNNSNTGTPDFSQIATTDEGVYSAQDDYGTSYYFRGAVENNYVKFAGYYWRIIRANGDGSLRLIYDGTSSHANGESSIDRHIGTSVYNNNCNDNTYVGYMYGSSRANSYNSTHSNTNNSAAKTAVDNWYKINIADKDYGKYIADVIYCNDRSLYSGGGYASQTTYYSTYNRLETNKNPVLTCSQKNDAFTVSDTSKGNGALTYPVGLITADEASLAGGVLNAAKINTNYYLYTGNHYWTMSPRNADYNVAYVSHISHRGYIGYFPSNHTTPESYIRPVISLKPDTRLIGNGTITSPFEVL